MAIYKDEKRGTYFVRIVGKDAVTGARCEHKKRGFKTKREAKEYGAEYINKSYGRTNQNASRINLSGDHARGDHHLVPGAEKTGL